MSRKPPELPYPAREVIFRSLLFLPAASVLAAALMLAVSYQVQAGAEGDRQKPPIIRTTTRLMNISVVVTDHKGNLVQGLTKDDFKIFDHGRAEKIAFFSSEEDKADGSFSTHPLPPGQYSNNPPGPGRPDQGATIILFDTVNSAYLSQANSIAAIRVFLSQLQPEDRVGIYGLNREGLKLIYDPGQPALALVEAMQRYDQTHHGGAESRITPPSENTVGSVELDHFLLGKDEHQPMSLCDPQRYLITIAAFQEIARSMVGLKGRKAIIWVTEHPPLSPVPWGGSNVFDLLPGEYLETDADCRRGPALGEPANLDPFRGSSRSRSVGPSKSLSALGAVPDQGLGGNDELDLLIRLFTQNDIVLYPVSAEGLQTLRIFGPGGAAPFPMRVANSGQTTTEVSDAVGAVANAMAHQRMEEIARRTGGRAFYNRNDLETGIRRALNDAKYGYELAYYPGDERWNGDWRKIQVKVNRPGVTVLARGGYFAFPESKILPPKASKQLLEEIAASPLEDTEIPITVKMTPPTSAAASVIEARVVLSAQNLFTNHGDGWKGDFEVLLFQLTADNKILDVTTEPVSVELTEEKHTDALKQGINTQAELQLKPGVAILYVLVHDKRTDAVGSVRIPLAQYASTLH